MRIIGSGSGYGGTDSSGCSPVAIILSGIATNCLSTTGCSSRASSMSSKVERVTKGLAVSVIGVAMEGWGRTVGSLADLASCNHALGMSISGHQNETTWL